MRCFLTIMFALFLCQPVPAQDVKPIIIGQKDLSIPQGESITIRLTDLYVEETAIEEGDEEDNGNEDDGNSGEGDEKEDNDGGPSDHDDNDQDEDESDKDGQDRDDDDSDDRGNKDDNKGDKDKDNNGDKKDDRGSDKGNKGDKKNKGDKDKSNGRSTYPEGYVLELFNGKSYTYNGNTVTPDASFTGILTVKLRVKNHKHASPTYDLKVSVLLRDNNQAPVITGQLPLSTPRDTPIEIKLSDLYVEDPDDQYPNGFTLKLVPSVNFSLNGSTVTPVPGFTGDLIVPVVVSDGNDESDPFKLKIVVSDASENVAPTITGQVALSISANQSVDIVLSNLEITDPDNEYPQDFSVHAYEGKNYSLEGTTVTPETDFTGELIVKVSVNDGNAESNVFDLLITVTPGANQRPAITGQTGIKIMQNEALEIQFHHLVVQDPDNTYPEGFSIAVLTGEHYTFENRTVTPSRDFLGTLTVAVTVHDGKEASDPFGVKIDVIKPDRLEILGQKTLEVAEDSTFYVKLSDLSVNDPTGTYPEGFILQLMGGSNYEVKNGGIRPHRNFTGNLTVPITVSKGANTSVPFNLLVVVLPVNDPPEILNLETAPLVINGSGPWPIAQLVEVADADDEQLVLAEIGFDKAGYHPGIDHLEFEKSENVHCIFDAEVGILFLVGRGKKEEYERLLRSIRYVHINGSDSLQHAGSKNIYLKLNDGNSWGPVYERALLMEANPSLEIPSAFTPNNDHANDTWKVVFATDEEGIETYIRVYDKKGVMVFEAKDLQTEWDGHFNGSPLPSDTYFYTIEMHLSHKKVNYKGIVSILR